MDVRICFRGSESWEMTLFSIEVALFGGLALLWLVGTPRVIRGMIRLPKLRTVDPLSDDACPRVSILVAARDAAAELPLALPTMVS